MAKIKPFKCIRPEEKLAGRVAALPYDVYSVKEAREIIEKEPFSFLKIDRPEAQFKETGERTDIYAKASETLHSMINEGTFIEDNEECYYVYELSEGDRIQTGIVGCVSIDDYINNVVKRHEQTRADKEIDRINHIEACNAHTGPIFLAYRNQSDIDLIIDTVKKEMPIYDFVQENGVGNKVWKVSEKSTIEEINNTFKRMDSIYIADGHHRAASAIKAGLNKRSNHPDYTGEEEFNYFLSVLFPDNQLKIMDYNRVVKDLNGYTTDEFINEISKVFDVKNKGKIKYIPTKKGTFGMHLDGVWYELCYKGSVNMDSPVEKLDVSILQNYLLNPILGIENPRTDERIDFVGGIRGLEELERRCESDMKVAFSMFPTSIKELFDVADEDMLMPPKSTWFEPKILSGLFIHNLD